MKAQQHTTAQDDRTEILALADVALVEANEHRQEWLATGDPLAWRRWRASLRDREMLLAEVVR